MLVLDGDDEGEEEEEKADGWRRWEVGNRRRDYGRGRRVAAMQMQNASNAECLEMKYAKKEDDEKGGPEENKTKSGRAESRSSLPQVVLEEVEDKMSRVGKAGVGCGARRKEGREGRRIVKGPRQNGNGGGC